MYFWERKFLEEKHGKRNGRESLKIFVETSPNKLLPYRIMTVNNFFT